MSRSGLLGFTLRALACEVDRVLRGYGAERPPDRAAPTATADDWRQVARACLLLASHAEQCALELEGDEENDERAPTAWFREVRHAWRHSPRMFARAILSLPLDYGDPRPPQVPHG